MAGKKKGQENISLQIEVETEMQWRTLLRREGLIVVDVYAGWAGPCTSMISILKRVKVEVNDERLWLATACSDNIADLLMFKDQSEPTWLFIGGGKPTKVFRGSNAPKLINTIKSEFANELACMQGKAKRVLISIDDEVSRRKKAESEAIKLAKMIKDEVETAEDLNTLRKESSTRLMGALEPYTILVIQNFLLETGAVTEIRDYLLGEFKIEQERYVNLNEEGVRNLFRIPREIPDPNEPEDFGYIPREEKETAALGVAALGSSGMEDDEMASNRSGMGSTRNSIDGSEQEEEVPLVQPNKRKMIPVGVPASIIGDTLIMLLESIEIRKMINKGIKPDTHSRLQTADDYIQLKVGPFNHKEALQHAPYSLHAIYGKGDYEFGVWCPRRYEDKRYVMINFFPRFVTEMLMPPPAADPKYTLAIFPAAKATTIPQQMEIHKKDIIAQGKVKLPAKLIDEMLKSNDLLKGEQYESKKKALSAKEVFAISVDRRNSEVMMALKSNEPVHISVDRATGRMESAKIFQDLDISLDYQGNPDEVVEKFLARSKKRVNSITEMNPHKPVAPRPVKVTSDPDITDAAQDVQELEIPAKVDQLEQSKASLQPSDTTDKSYTPKVSADPSNTSVQQMEGDEAEAGSELTQETEESHMEAEE